MATKKRKAKGARSRRTTRTHDKLTAKTKAKAAGHRKKESKARRHKQRIRGAASSGVLVAYERRGLGARSAGQAGDTQGLSAAPDVDSESVEELMQEGQSFEAEVLDGIENAPDPDEAEVTTHEVPEDDVPDEYTEKN